MSEEPPEMPPSQSSTLPAVQKTSVAAVWSLVFGVSSFCTWLLGSIPALILGGLALSRINGSQGQLGGRGIAIAGMVTGGVGTIAGLFTAAMLAGIFIPVFSGTLNKAKITRQMNDVKIIAITCRAYAADHDGNFPAELKELYPDYIQDENALKTYGQGGVINADYIYFPGYRDDSPAKTKPLIAAPVSIGGGRVMGLVGGEVVEVPEDEFQRLMKALEGAR